MSTSAGLPVEERLRQLCTHLGIRRAHVAARMPEDWHRFVATSPERCASLTLVGGAGIAPAMVGTLASRLLLFQGDQGPFVAQVRRVMDHLPGAQLVALQDYNFLPWTDALADRTDTIATAMLTFLAQITPPASWERQPPLPGDGEVAGVSYRLRGAGPPLLLLPLGLSPSQWEPVIPQLSAHYCTITLGGAAVGIVANLESRGQAAGYRSMLRTLLAEVAPRPGDSLLEVGCGSGAVSRWLAQETRGAHRITAVDMNPYLLREATALAQQAGLTDTLTFRDGRAEALPFADQTFDVALAVTVLEEGDADRMLTEMLRVLRPGGRVGVIVRAYDRPFLINLPLRPALLHKLEEPSSWAPGVAVGGCADASLYRRFHQAGLTAVKMLPQLAAFDGTTSVLLEFLLNRLLPTLTADEAQEWQTVHAQADAEGTFWIAWPHHCAVGTKP